jgi:hypothetical protein
LLGRLIGGHSAGTAVAFTAQPKSSLFTGDTVIGNQFVTVVSVAETDVPSARLADCGCGRCSRLTCRHRARAPTAVTAVVCGGLRTRNPILGNQFVTVVSEAVIDVPCARRADRGRGRIADTAPAVAAVVSFEVRAGVPVDD